MAEAVSVVVPTLPLTTLLVTGIEHAFVPVPVIAPTEETFVRSKSTPAVLEIVAQSSVSPAWAVRVNVKDVEFVGLAGLADRVSVGGVVSMRTVPDVTVVLLVALSARLTCQR